MKNRTTLVLLVIIFAAYYFYDSRTNETSLSAGSGQIEQAFQLQQSNVQVEAEGTVTRLLSDDNEGSRHQRFIVELNTGQTILIAHNIDLAPRLNDLKEGDQVRFYGEYEWNPQGGVVHWTHHDPAGRHPGGWIKHNGRTYQ